MAKSSFASSRAFSLGANSKWTFLPLWPLHGKHEWLLLHLCHVVPMLGSSSPVSALNLLSSCLSLPVIIVLYRECVASQYLF